jgi:hypothetical protein
VFQPCAGIQIAEHRVKDSARSGLIGGLPIIQAENGP